MGLFGSFFIIGIVIGCVTLTRLGDTLGRKPVFIMGMIIQTVSIFIAIVIVNLYIEYAVFFLLGISLTAKVYVGFNYLLEN